MPICSDVAYRELEELNKKIIHIFSQLRAVGADLPNENKDLPEDDLVLYYVAESHIVKEQQDWIALMKSRSQRRGHGQAAADEAAETERSVRMVATQLDRASQFQVASIWFQVAQNIPLFIHVYIPLHTYMQNIHRMRSADTRWTIRGRARPTRCSCWRCLGSIARTHIQYCEATLDDGNVAGWVRSPAMKTLLYSLMLMQMGLLLFHVPSCYHSVSGRHG